jgi:hypothetical protein
MKEPMVDHSTIESELHRFVARLLDSGIAASSIGMELLMLGMVMLTKGEHFRRILKPADNTECSPPDTGYSAIG